MLNVIIPNLPYKVASLQVPKFMGLNQWLRSNSMPAINNSLIYNVKMKVLVENKFPVKTLFADPFEPVQKLDGYLIDTVNSG